MQQATTRTREDRPWPEPPPIAIVPCHAGDCGERSVEPEAEGFVLSADGRPLRTPGGKPFWHAESHLLEHVAAELERGGSADPTQLSLYALVCAQRDLIEDGHGSLAVHLGELLLEDPALRRCAAPEAEHLWRRWWSVLDYLEEHGVVHPDLPLQVPADEVLAHLDAPARANFERLVALMAAEYGRLGPAQATVLLSAVNGHGSLLLALLLVVGRLGPREYAAALLAAHGVDPTLDPGLTPTEQRRTLDGTRADAELFVRYLNLAKA